jgi:hypothetical protein
MRVHFERSGGFAGLRMSCTIDSDELPDDEAHALREEIEQASFFNLPHRLFEPAVGADRFQYEVSVDMGEREHTVEVGEAAMPDSLRPLIQHLERLMRTMR